MAKVKGPLMSINAQGKYASNVIFRSTKNGSIATRFHSPNSVNPGSPSAAQLANRALYGAAVAAWRALTAPQKTAYDVLGTPENLSGWNYFLRQEILSPLFSVSDDFVRADENPLASPWSSISSFFDFQLVSNMANNVADGAGRKCQYYNAVFSSDQYSEATVGLLSPNEDIGISLRNTASQAGYLVSFYFPSPGIFKYISGSWVPVVAFSHTGLVVGDIIRGECVGTSLEVFLNGVSLVTVSDSSYSAGFPGIFSDENGSAFSQFEAGDL